MLPLDGTLLEKLRKIEALHAGTKIDREREAARRAAERIRGRLARKRRLSSCRGARSAPTSLAYSASEALARLRDELSLAEWAVEA
jgi:hypothetical protein